MLVWIVWAWDSSVLDLLRHVRMHRCRTNRPPHQPMQTNRTMRARTLHPRNLSRVTNISNEAATILISPQKRKHVLQISKVRHPYRQISISVGTKRRKMMCLHKVTTSLTWRHLHERIIENSCQIQMCRTVWINFVRVR